MKFDWLFDYKKQSAKTYTDIRVAEETKTLFIAKQSVITSEIFMQKIMSNKLLQL